MKNFLWFIIGLVLVLLFSCLFLLMKRYQYYSLNENQEEIIQHELGNRVSCLTETNVESNTSELRLTFHITSKDTIPKIFNNYELKILDIENKKEIFPDTTFYLQPNGFSLDTSQSFFILDGSNSYALGSKFRGKDWPDKLKFLVKFSLKDSVIKYYSIEKEVKLRQKFRFSIH